MLYRGSTLRSILVYY